MIHYRQAADRINQTTVMTFEIIYIFCPSCFFIFEYNYWWTSWETF